MLGHGCDWVLFAYNMWIKYSDVVKNNVSGFVPWLWSDGRLMFPSPTRARPWSLTGIEQRKRFLFLLPSPRPGPNERRRPAVGGREMAAREGRRRVAEAQWLLWRSFTRRRKSGWRCPDDEWPGGGEGRKKAPTAARSLPPPTTRHGEVIPTSSAAHSLSITHAPTKHNKIPPLYCTPNTVKPNSRAAEQLDGGLGGGGFESAANSRRFGLTRRRHLLRPLTAATRLRRPSTDSTRGFGALRNFPSTTQRRKQKNPFFHLPLRTLRPWALEARDRIPVFWNKLEFFSG